MPNYNYTGFEPQRPFGSFIAGMGAANQMQYSALRSEAAREALNQQREQKAALQTYKNTGDSRELIPYMTPEQAMTAPSAEELQKLKVGAAAVDWWDKVKGNATLETYPAIMADATKRFPSIAQMHFPPAESFRTPADFEKWKYRNEMMAAHFKQIASPYLARPITFGPGGGVAIDPITRQKIYEQPAAPKEYKPEAFIGPNGEVRWIRPGSTVPAGFSKPGPGGGGRAGSNRLENFTDYLASVRRGEDSVLPANASYDQVMFQFRKRKAEGEAAGKAVYPKPLTPIETLQDKVTNPHKYGADGQLKPQYRPGATGKQPVSGVQRMLPSRNDPNKMIPATEEQYKAWHGIK